MKSLLFCLFCLLGAGNAAQNPISPTQYTLQLSLVPSTDSFSGYLEIVGKVNDGGRTFVDLHNDGLNISLISVKQSGAEMFRSLTTNRTTGLSTIELTQGLSTLFDVTMSISYEGNVSSDGTGLFSFVDNGQKIYMTNFYPIHARKVLPCFDDPAYPATFAMTLSIPTADAQLIASTGLISKTNSAGLTHFELSTTTSPIPLYSMFFTLGNWQNNYKVRSANTTIWIPPSLSKTLNLIDRNLESALDNSNITFIRGDFNHHLNIFISPVLSRNSYSGLNTVVLHYDISVTDLGETTTNIHKQNFVKISYALYKVFYGTTIFPDGWGNNWLSDSLSTYLAYKALDEIRVYGNSDASLITDLDEFIFTTCWGDDTAVTFKSESPTAPKDIMNFVTGPGMAKGAYAVKTLEVLVNDANMYRNALLYYLRNNYGPKVNTSGFIDYIETNVLRQQSSTQSIQNIILPMISQAGYPVITLTRSQQTLAMSKSAFSYLSPTSVFIETTPSTKLFNVDSWQILVTSISSLSNNNVSVYCVPSDKPDPVNLYGTFAENQWAALDLNGTGMMRINYDNQTWRLLSTQAMTQFSPAMRAKMVADAFAAAESGQQYWSTVLNFLLYLDGETELAPWKVAIDGFNRMWTWIYHSNSANYDASQRNLTEAFTGYVWGRMRNMYTKLGTRTNNSDPHNELRSEIIGGSCEFNNTACVQDLADQYAAYQKGLLRLSNDMYSVIMCNGLRGLSTSQDWIKVYQLYVHSGKWYNQALKNSHYAFLACPDTKDGLSSAPIDSFLKFILMNVTVTPFPKDQVKHAMQAIIDKPQHIDQVLTFFLNNRVNFSKNIDIDMQVDLMNAIGDRLMKPSQANQLREYYKNHTDVNPILGSAINASIDKVANWESVLSKIQEDVYAGLSKSAPPVPTAPPTVHPSVPTGTIPTSPNVTLSPPSTTPGRATLFAVSSFTLLISLLFATFVL